MQFDPDDLDWAMGELAQLFTRANLHSIYPHELDPELFRAAWSVVTAQPWEVALKCRDSLMAMSSGKWQHARAVQPVKRYAVTLTH